MAYCKKCGAQLEEGTKFCGSCGASVEEKPAEEQQAQAKPEQQPQAQQGLQQGIDKLANLAKNTADETADHDPADIEKNKTMAGLAYILFFLPIVACPDSKFGRFHANQGLVFLIASIVAGIARTIVTSIILAISWRLVWFTSLLSFVVGIAILAVGIIGLMNGFNGKAKELPFIGKFRILK